MIFAKIVDDKLFKGTLIFTPNGAFDAANDGTVPPGWSRVEDDANTTQEEIDNDSIILGRKQLRKILKSISITNKLITLNKPLALDNAAVAETPTATHTITIQDSTGARYKALCARVAGAD
ncbi:MAG: hypothetical protein GY938_17015 [Ketobacter sp.]|nr:hypothetical protein [Ketobacter sp.]